MVAKTLESPGLSAAYRTRVSGSGMTLPRVPWIALLDRDVTTTAQEGLYVAYLFDVGCTNVYLSMNQGATQHRLAVEATGLRGRRGQDAAKAALVFEAALIRSALEPKMFLGLDAAIDLGSLEFLPSAYEAGNIVSVRYEVRDLPSNSDLAADLLRFLRIYDACVQAKTDLLAAREIRTSAVSRSIQRVNSENRKRRIEFRPKDSSDYVVNIAAATKVKSRKHEALVHDFGEWIKRLNGRPNTNVHPRDLVIQMDGKEWLVEAKIVGISPQDAVRQAIGQLFEYRWFLYGSKVRSSVLMLALFDAPVGRGFSSLLDGIGIHYVFRGSSGWCGCPHAQVLVGEGHTEGVVALE